MAAVLCLSPALECERSHVLVSSLYFCLTEPELGGEEAVTRVVSSLQCDVLEELEHLYVPLVLRYVVSTDDGSHTATMSTADC